MACRLVGAKPLSKPMMEYCYFDPWEQTSMKSLSKLIHCHSRKCIWKCRLEKATIFSRPQCVNSGGDRNIPGDHGQYHGWPSSATYDIDYIWRINEYFHSWRMFQLHTRCQCLRGVIQNSLGVTARFVTRSNLWLRHDLWPQNASICDPARFVTKSASICDQRYTMILESKLCRGNLVFVFTLIMYTKWNNMIIYIYMNYDIMLIWIVGREVWCCLH